MKKAIINFILVLLLITGVFYAALSNGLQFFIGFMVAYPAILGLVRFNSKWMEEC